MEFFEILHAKFLEEWEDHLFHLQFWWWYDKVSTCFVIFLSLLIHDLYKRQKRTRSKVDKCFPEWKLPPPTKKKAPTKHCIFFFCYDITANFCEDSTMPPPSIVAGSGPHRQTSPCFGQRSSGSKHVLVWCDRLTTKCRDGDEENYRKFPSNTI